jgi:two-component system chemotaxis response regulator CheB
VAAVLGPRENGHRPCIDALFRTAAQYLGPRVVAVVLSGSDDDGTTGALAVRQRGGLVYAQSADDALYPMMPQSVVRRAGVDGQAPASELGALVAGAVGRSAPARSVRSVPAPSESDAELAREAAVNEDWPGAVLGEPVGNASGFVCPDCSGTLFTVTDEPVLRFRCRIGHAWTADGLVAQQAAAVETALWTAVRTLHERAELSQRLAHRAIDEGRPASAQQFHDAARDARGAAGVLHELLAGGSGRTPLTARSTESNEAGGA